MLIYNINESYSFKYILGLLNSNVIRFWHKKVFPEGLHIKIYQLKTIPIPNVPHCLQQPIINLVDKVLSEKRANPSADTSALESDIDRIVYPLYGLTDEEIRIIEDSTK